MGIDLKNPGVQFALELIQFGSELACRIRAESSVKTILKGDRSPVTLADMGIQAIAGALLEQYFSEANLVAEEDADYLKTPEGAEDLEKITGYVHSFFPHARPARVCQWIDKGKGKPSNAFWTLDPIDGTKGFLRGDQYAIALAFIQGKRVELAAMACPELELRNSKFSGKGIGIFAARGCGCWAVSLEDPEDLHQWVRLKASQCRDVNQARILYSLDPQHTNMADNQRVYEMLGLRTEPIFMDSLAKHAMIATGGAEIFFRTLSKMESGRREKIWDVAAGALIIEEAGGRVTDLEGQELDFSAGFTLARNPGLVVTNGLLHRIVLDALRQATCL